MGSKGLVQIHKISLRSKLLLCVVVIFLAGVAVGMISARAVLRQRLHKLGISNLEDAARLAHSPEPALRTDWGQLWRFTAADKDIPPGKVVFFGDSIIEWRSLPNGWVNRGIGGQTTAHMIVRFRQDVIDLRPSVVVILAGTNDARIGQEPIENTEGNIQTMVELAKLHGVRPILCSLLPTGHHPIDSPSDPVSEVNEINEWLRNYAAKQNVVYVDFYDAMIGANDAMRPNLTKDGIHPSLSGYELMHTIIEGTIPVTK
jgi:lysophospholipase L1-like esterase